MTQHRANRYREGARVRVRPRVVPRDDTDARAAASIRAVLREAEGRFHALQARATESEPMMALEAHLNILYDLRGVAERLHEAAQRRDISYLADRRLALLTDHCRWLARRVTAEFLLILGVYLEQDLKDTICSEGYQKFLRLEEVEDAALEVESLSDKDLMGKLQIGTILSEVLDQAGLHHLLGRLRQGPTSTPPINEEVVGE